MPQFSHCRGDSQWEDGGGGLLRVLAVTAEDFLHFAVGCRICGTIVLVSEVRFIRL
jgi:hypothetical protein